MAFMEDLLKEASIEEKGAGGKKGVSARSVRKVREGVLAKYRG
jgi:hypothetical protein